MGKALRRSAGESGSRRHAGLTGNRESGVGNRGPSGRFGLRFPVPDSRFPAWLLAAVILLIVAMHAGAQEPELRMQRGRFTILAYPSDRPLAQSLLAAAIERDTFPGLPRPRRPVVIAVAPDRARFREWIGPSAPEWGAAVAFPDSSHIVMQGRTAGSDAGDPIVVLRHELAHLAPLDSLDAGFAGGSLRAEGTYALAYRAVAELAARDPERGLTLFFQYWKETQRFDLAVRRAYGITQAQFEAIWQSRTRRRYGGLALFADLSIAAAVTLFLVLPFYIIRKRRDRLRMAALVRADQEAERRDAMSAIEALLRSIRPPQSSTDIPQSPQPDESSRPPQGT